MIGHGKWRLSAVGIVAHHRNVLSLSNDSESEHRECFNYFRLWGVDREFWQLSSYLGFCNKHFEDGRINFKNFVSKSLEMETNCRLHVGERFFVAITLTHNDAFEAERISDVSVRVFFDNDLLGFHGGILAPTAGFVQVSVAHFAVSDDFWGRDPRASGLQICRYGPPLHRFTNENSICGNRLINLSTTRHKLFRFLFHPHTQRHLFINLLLRRILPHVLRNFHRAEMRPAH
jgi:hypothetical protein